MSRMKGINEALKSALLSAGVAGVGDEDIVLNDDREPVVLTKSEEDDIRKRKEALRQLEEEEERVAKLSVDPNALLPFEDMSERAKYIPVRLSYEERKSLRLITAAISVSDYTNTVDMSFKNKAKRKQIQLQCIVAFLSGIVAATRYESGNEVLKDRNFTEFEGLFKDSLEIARRYKITNPEKMRSEYGKLVYLMQDAVSPSIQELVEVDIHKPVFTVYDILTRKDGLRLLQDRRIVTATEEILSEGGKNSRAVIQQRIARKEKAVEAICREHRTHKLSADDIRLCLYSITDNNSYLNSNQLPVDQCISLLRHYFSPDEIEDGYSLSIDEDAPAEARTGSTGSGSRLTHSHRDQYYFVMQSLQLWSTIIGDMFRLWYLAEQDLLSESQPYELTNTGQGLQRVQQSPRVYRAMHEILARTKVQLLGGAGSSTSTGALSGGQWVGSSVIHLGDRNVPNALVFIDKYTQVSRILGPLVNTLRQLDKASHENEGVARYVASYGGLEKAKKDILLDFFRHGFDGSGGDNFFDAGSCIDGRLTSAWNWCSQLTNKPYYPLFKLTGFLSFDGEFDK